MSILQVYPRANIYLSCALVTKDSNLNRLICEYNDLLFDISKSHRNIRLIRHPDISDPFGNLKIHLGRHIHGTNRPDVSDYLHLGNLGMKIFAATIKETVRYKKPAAKHKPQVPTNPSQTQQYSRSLMSVPPLSYPRDQGTPRSSPSRPVPPLVPLPAAGYPGLLPPPFPPRTPGLFAGDYVGALNRSSFQGSLSMQHDGYQQ